MKYKCSKGRKSQIDGSSDRACYRSSTVPTELRTGSPQRRYFPSIAGNKFRSDLRIQQAQRKLFICEIFF